MTISVIGQSAMDGRTGFSSGIAGPAPLDTASVQTSSSHEPAQLAQNIGIDPEQLQRLSRNMGRELRFNVNRELDRVIVKIVDPETDKVIKEIPSADIQKLQLHIKESIGLLIDEKI